MDIQTALKIFATLAVSIGVLLVVRASVRREVAEDERSKVAGWVAEAKERRRNWEAWSFFDWCNSIPLAELAASPPAERFKIHRARSGMWFVSAYMGVGRGHNRYTMTVGGLNWPVAVPDASHIWDVIGPSEGFLTRDAAEMFAQIYAFADSSPLTLSANLQRLES